MDELFNLLSSSARIDKSKRKKKKEAPSAATPATAAEGESDHDRPTDDDEYASSSSSDSDSSSSGNNNRKRRRKKSLKSRDRTNKRDNSAAKLRQIHREQISAFRRRMGIRLSDNNRHDASVPDPISTFDELRVPQSQTAARHEAAPGFLGWLSDAGRTEYSHIINSILRNVEGGRWTEPTPIQMQAVPSLMRRRDVMGCAPTGSGKTGAFVLPGLILSGLSEESFYGTVACGNGTAGDRDRKGKKKGKGKGKKEEDQSFSSDQTGRIRSLLLAPSRELASQLHREVERLGQGKPGGLRSALLSKNNASLISSNRAGGKRGLDVLVATPLRLVECLERGLDLGSVRLVVLDEADRLLDCTDGGLPTAVSGDAAAAERDGGDDSSSDSEDDSESDEDESSSSDDEDDRRRRKKGRAGQKKNKKKKQEEKRKKHEQQQQQQPHGQQSGSSHAKTFLEQIDSILASCPTTAVRALFSATLGPAVRHLSESVLRNPVDVTAGLPGGSSTSAAGAATSPAANSDIDQSLMFVGREEGKLLAIRQLIQRGIKPPVIIFLQSKDRAQALFGELLYDGVNVDVIHAGRSQAARDAAVAKFRKGETWILICTDLVARGVDFKAVNMVINYDLPTSGVTYVHRIGRTGRAGRKGTAVTLFTEADFDSIRPIANVMKLSGCAVPDWILTLKKGGGGAGGGSRSRHHGHGGTKERIRAERDVPKRKAIDTTPGYDKAKRKKKKQSIENSLKRKQKKEEEGRER